MTDWRDDPAFIAAARAAGVAFPADGPAGSDGDVRTAFEVWQLALAHRSSESSMVIRQRAFDLRDSLTGDPAVRKTAITCARELEAMAVSIECEDVPEATTEIQLMREVASRDDRMLVLERWCEMLHAAASAAQKAKGASVEAADLMIRYENFLKGEEAICPGDPE